MSTKVTFAALGGELEGYAGYADDLGLGVAHGVDGIRRFPDSTSGGSRSRGLRGVREQEDVNVDDLGTEREFCRRAR